MPTSLPRAIAIALAIGLPGCIEVQPDRPQKTAEAHPSEPVPVATASAPAHGFNDDIAWRHLDEGLSALERGEGPMMLLVHASWCESCKRLRPQFADEELAALSKRFVMVNVDQDEIPKALSYAPDGSYIPRVLFFDPSTGALDPEIKNPRRARNHYYYGPLDDLVASMRTALERHERS